MPRSLDILMVEDNPADVALMERALEKSGAHIELHVVPDGEAALKYLRKQNSHEFARRPDLVLLDINLPRLSGFEVLNAVRKDRELRRLPVLMLSVSDNPDDVRQSYDSGANSYMTKPGRFAEFVDMIKTLDSYWRTVCLPNGHVYA